jgi:phosphoglycerate kinase
VKADDSIGPEVEEKVVALPNGGVLLLENLKFYKEEKKNDPEHAKKLASNADFYVNDAFGIAHLHMHQLRALGMEYLSQS